ncbi:restriction endonuclease subunit S [Acinetobacter sp. 3657]|uniref:restriction endonuclease subunit S n=1 Tax=Acinetobacter sp. 3657 TaxID=2817764 RepID=UPI0028634D09|nr:type I restriction enzyme S subunit [Prolinoborus sp. 3657]
MMFAKYDAYKDSGDKWIGKTPTGWFNERLGTILEPISIKGNADKDLLSITRERGVILRDIEDDSENHNFIPDDLSNYKLIEKGQFGMNKMKAWQGSYGVSPYTGIVSPAYYIFRFIKPIYPDFFHWAIRSKTYISFFGSASDGVRIGQWDLSKDRMKNIPFVFPNIDSQKKIVEFIKDKAGKIDQAIAIKEQQIALLNERKQIVIQKAVTQGLDPNVPMKDSGVEWIGQIPEHWHIKKLKYLAQVEGGFAFSSDSFKDEGVQLLKISNLYMNTLSLERQPTFLDEKYLNTHSKWVVSKGDILMSLTGTLGKKDYGFAVLLEDDNKFFLNQRVGKINFNTDIDKFFILNQLQSDVFLDQIYQLPSGTKQANLSNEHIENVYLIIPNLNEQKHIANFIAELVQANQILIENTLKEIDLLKEYKTTLINDAVTGKIKVA